MSFIASIMPLYDIFQGLLIRRCPIATALLSSLPRSCGPVVVQCRLKHLGTTFNI